MREYHKKKVSRERQKQNLENMGDYQKLLVLKGKNKIKLN